MQQYAATTIYMRGSQRTASPSPTARGSRKAHHVNPASGENHLRARHVSSFWWPIFGPSTACNNIMHLVVFTGGAPVPTTGNPHHATMCVCSRQPNPPTSEHKCAGTCNNSNLDFWGSTISCTVDFCDMKHLRVDLFV